MRRRAIPVLLPLLLAAAVAGALAPAAAVGATVSADQAGTVTVEAAAGEANQLAIEPAGTDWRVSESGPGAVLGAGAGCTQSGANEVTCGGSNTLLVVRAGDGGDRVAVSGAIDAVLDGGTGIDEVSGGDGDDRLDSRDDGADTVRCGAGYDVVTADFSDTVGADCELTELAPSPQPQPQPPPPGPAPEPGGTPPPPQPHPGFTTIAPVFAGSPVRPVTFTGVVFLPIRCPSTAERRCKGSITLTIGRGDDAEVLGRGRFSARPGETTDARARLSRRGRRRVLRRRRTRCRVSIVTRGADGRRLVIRRYITLAAARARR